MLQQIHTIEWLACSPDLNPIEHVWDKLGRTVRRCINQHNTLLDLRHYLHGQWNALHEERIRRLINSMRQCCQACVSKGNLLLIVNKLIQATQQF